VRRRAEDVGVCGWITNRDDGAVEAVFEGDADAVEAMVEFARRGPGRAEVERLDVSEEKPEGLNGFEIR
jgi:acylphosphatase